MIKVTDMFATPMVEARFPNHAPLCAALAKLFLEKEREGERYRDPQKRLTQFGPLFESRFDLFKWTDPPVVEVARFTHTCLSQLIQQITNYGPEDLGRLRFDYHAWFHVTRKGGYQGVHNHQNASWSGIFCVDPGDPVPDRPESGLVRFYDPRTCAYYYSDAGNLGLRMPYQHGGYDLIHQAGRLVMFPSHLNHEIFPYLGERPRIVIAFNCSIN
jgi:hypothetical protein